MKWRVDALLYVSWCPKQKHILKHPIQRQRSFFWFTSAVDWMENWVKKQSQISTIIVQILLNKMFNTAWFSEKLLIKSIGFSTSFYTGDQSQLGILPQIWTSRKEHRSLPLCTRPSIPPQASVAFAALWHTQKCCWFRGTRGEHRQQGWDRNSQTQTQCTQLGWRQRESWGRFKAS